jgi:hypothetical protein
MESLLRKTSKCLFKSKWMIRKAQAPEKVLIWKGKFINSLMALYGWKRNFFIRGLKVPFSISLGGVSIRHYRLKGNWMLHSLHSGFHVEISADAISLAKYSSRIGSIIQRQMDSVLLLEGIRWFTKGLEWPLIISPAGEVPISCFLWIGCWRTYLRCVLPWIQNSSISS